MQPEEVRAFKNELRNYSFLLHEIVTLENSIENIYDRLGGVRGIDPSREPTHSLPNKDLEYKLRGDIDKLETKLKLRTNQKEYIDTVMSKIESPVREAVFDIYVLGKRFDNVADKYAYSHNGLYKRINKAIEGALHGKI